MVRMSVRFQVIANLSGLVLFFLFTGVGYATGEEQGYSLKQAIQAVVQEQLDQEVMNAVSEQVSATGDAQTNKKTDLESTPAQNYDDLISKLTSVVDAVLKVDESKSRVIVSSSHSELDKPRVLAVGSSAESNEQVVVKQETDRTSAAVVQFQSTALAHSEKQGWMYIGQYVDSQWREKILKISNQLPESGVAYQVDAAVHVRDALPSDKGMSKIVASLGKNDQVKVLRVKASGRKGHYWALVER